MDGQGDDCDPFPSDPNNELLQCELDLDSAIQEADALQLQLDQSLVELGTCTSNLDEVSNAWSVCEAELAECMSCVPTRLSERGMLCWDGIDNDCDHVADEEDPDCHPWPSVENELGPTDRGTDDLTEIERDGGP